MSEQKGLAASVRLLGREGFQVVDAKVWATLASLHNHGVFRVGGTLVGSRAFGVLINSLGARTAAYATEDIDIARGARLAFETETQADLLTVLGESGIDFVAPPELDSRQPSTSFGQRGHARFKVDLLVPAKASELAIVPVPELRAHATSVPYLAYLVSQTQLVPVLAREGACAVRTPTPERFAVHKMLVSQLRRARSTRSAKDLLQACTLLAVLADTHPGAIEEAVERVPASARRHLRAALPQARDLLLPSHPRAQQALTEAA